MKRAAAWRRGGVAAEIRGQVAVAAVRGGQLGAAGLRQVVEQQQVVVHSPSGRGALAPQTNA